jgi:tetratricopeptide (TPR) repeat protein
VPCGEKRRSGNQVQPANPASAVFRRATQLDAPWPKDEALLPRILEKVDEEMSPYEVIGKMLDEITEFIESNPRQSEAVLEKILRSPTPDHHADSPIISKPEDSSTPMDWMPESLHPMNFRDPYANTTAPEAPRPPPYFAAASSALKARVLTPRSTQGRDLGAGEEAEQQDEELVLFWWKLVDKFPSNTEFQVNLTRAYQDKEFAQRETGWYELVKRHPGNRRLQMELAKVFESQNNIDKAIETWWSLLKRNPNQLGLFRCLRDAVLRKHPSALANSSLVRFIWIWILSLASLKLSDWGMGETNWLPLATEDELMMVRPFTLKRRWHCVRSQI